MLPTNTGWSGACREAGVGNINRIEITKTTDKGPEHEQKRLFAESGEGKRPIELPVRSWEKRRLSGLYHVRRGLPCCHALAVVP